jgi:hypothetical protein
MLVAVGAFGCGGGGTADAPTKVAFIKQADAICARADSKQESEFRSYVEKHPANKLTRAQQSSVIVTIALPPIKAEAEEISELTPPDGDDDQVQKIVEGMEQGVKAAEKRPMSMSPGPNNPFNDVDQLSTRYGFKACSEAS